MTPPTAILLLNMGGPKTIADVGPFLLELFKDRDLIQLPYHNILGPFIAKIRTKAVQKNYTDIGGGSPILKWTEAQGASLVERLDILSPNTAPHKYYIAFRYAYPFAQDALKQMKSDGVKRAVAFSQYPHYSCATTGSSLNDLWKQTKEIGLENEFNWSIIDRWGSQAKFIEAMIDTVRLGLEKFTGTEKENLVIIFSAHSLPMKIIHRGDPYPAEIAATVHELMKKLDYQYNYVLSYQSEVGPVSWLGASTESVIKNLGAQGHKNILVVGVAFINDHIETLHELDIEYAELAKESGISKFVRAPALNNSVLFLDALASISFKHLGSSQIYSKQYKMHCPGCENPDCRNILNPVKIPG